MPEPREGQEGTEQQVEQNAPDPLDYYDRIDTSKAEKAAGIGGTRPKEAGKEPSKLQQYFERAKDVLERAKGSEFYREAKGFAQSESRENVMSGKEFRELMVRFAREEGTERLAKAGARQIAGSALPVIANTSMAIYDAWDTYRDFRQFVEQARKHSDIKPVKDAKNPKPFYEIAQQKKEAEAIKHEKDEWRGIGKPTYNQSADQLELSNGMTPTEYGRQVKSSADRIRYAPPTLQETLSLKAHQNSQAGKNFIAESRYKAEQYEKMAMKAGADYKYHWLLQQAEKELGSGFFNPVTNPNGAIAFDRYAAEHLRVSRFSEREVHEVVGKGVCCSVLSPEVGYKTNNPTKELQQLYHRTVGPKSVDLDLRRTGVESFQNGHRIASDFKLTQEEATIQSHLQEQAVSYSRTRVEENKLLAKQVLEEYHLSIAQHPDQSTSYQFLLQYGRELANGHQQPHIGDITYKLHVAGHQKNDIVMTLQQYHPDLNQSQELAKREYQRVLDYTHLHPVRPDEMKLIQEHKQTYNLQEEKRLDRLPFVENRAFSQLPNDKPMSGQRDHSHDFSPSRTETRDREIER